MVCQYIEAEAGHNCPEGVPGSNHNRGGSAP